MFLPAGQPGLMYCNLKRVNPPRGTGSLVHAANSDCCRLQAVKFYTDVAKRLLDPLALLHPCNLFLPLLA